MWQGAPWCFTNNAWTLSTEYLIEWGARWGPYMKKEPYRYATCHAASNCLLPDAQLPAALSLALCLPAFCPVSALALYLLVFWLLPLPCCLLACAPALSLPAFGLLPLPFALLPLISGPAPASAFLFHFGATIFHAAQQLRSTSMLTRAHAVKCHLAVLTGGFPAS